MTTHAPNRCFLWPCPKCFKAAREKHKNPPRKPEKEKPKETEEENNKKEGDTKEKKKNGKKEVKKDKKKKTPCPGICSLWPCTNCIKASRRRYKAKLKQEQKETEDNLAAKPSHPSKPAVKLYIMDPYHNWIEFNPLMMMGQDEATNDCQCGTCRSVREQAMQQPAKAPSKPKDPVDVDDGLNNLRLSTIHPMVRRIQHQPKKGQKQPPPQQHATPHVPPAPEPSYGGSGQNVYIWPCGVTNITFPIVDYTRNPFAASGFPGPLFYMATLPNTAKISDLIARLAPANSGKVLMVRSHKGGECFDAASATCLTSLQRQAMQLEVWSKDDVDDSDGDGDGDGKDENPRVTSASTNKSNQSKKSKGKKTPTRSPPSPDKKKKKKKKKLTSRWSRQWNHRRDLRVVTAAVKSLIRRPLSTTPGTSHLRRCLRTFRR